MPTINDWIQDHEVWYQGDEQNGSGVFQEPDGKWHGNLVHPDLIDVQGFGPYESREDCINAIIEEFERIEKLNEIVKETDNALPVQRNPEILPESSGTL